MSLEIIDRLLDNWKNPEYTGFNEILHYYVFENKDEDYERSFRATLDAENSKYVKLNHKSIDMYGSTKEDLLAYYADFNIKPSYIDSKIKRNIHKLKYISYDSWDILFDKYTNPESKNILEIGFQGGFSSLYMLGHTTAEIVNIDVMKFDFNYYGKTFVDAKYPGRHTMFVGMPMDLEKTIDTCYPNIKFDIIFITLHRDFKHIQFYKKYAHEDTIVLLRGPTPHEAWGIKTYMAMNKAISEGLIILLEHSWTDEYEYASMAVFKYNFKDHYVQKLPLKKYIQMEYKVLLTEFLSFINLDYDNNTGRVNTELVHKYKEKLAEFGLTFSEKILESLKNKFNIIP